MRRWAWRILIAGTLMVIVAVAGPFWLRWAVEPNRTVASVRLKPPGRVVTSSPFVLGDSGKFEVLALIELRPDKAALSQSRRILFAGSIRFIDGGGSVLLIETFEHQLFDGEVGKTLLEFDADEIGADTPVTLEIRLREDDAFAAYASEVSVSVEDMPWMILAY